MHIPSTPHFFQAAQTQFEETLSSLGSTALSVIAGASLVAAVVGSLGLFGSLARMSTALPLPIKVCFLLIGTSATLFTLHIKNKYYPSQEDLEEDDPNQNILVTIDGIQANLNGIRADFVGMQINKAHHAVDVTAEV